MTGAMLQKNFTDAAICARSRSARGFAQSKNGRISDELPYREAFGAVRCEARFNSGAKLDSVRSRGGTCFQPLQKAKSGVCASLRHRTPKTWRIPAARQ